MTLAVGHERRSAAEPFPLWSNASYAINILPLKTKVKHRVPCSPTRDCPFELEITFCVRGTTALWANVVIGAINFIATILGMSLIDRAGRKPLLMSAFGGMALSLMAVSAAIHFQASAIVVLIFVLTYVACFAVGVGTGTWVMMAEICPTRIRGRAMSVATIFLWCGTLLVTLTFLSLVHALTAPGTFLLYAAVSIAAFLFVWRMVPETKGRTLEEIDRWWRARPS